VLPWHCSKYSTEKSRFYFLVLRRFHFLTIFANFKK